MVEKQRIEEVFIFDSVNRGEDVSLSVVHSNSFPSEEEQSFGLWNDEEYRRKLLEKREQIAKHPVYYDGVNLFFDCLTRDSKGNRVMYMRDTLYSTHKTLEQTLIARAVTEPNLKTRLIRTGNIVAVVETSDGKLVFGYRSGGSEDFGGMYLPPAGFTDHRKNTDPNKGPVNEDFFDRLTDEEIVEEVGIDPGNKKKNYLGFVGGLETRCADTVTYVRLDQSSEQVEEAFQALNKKLRETGGRIEHDHLIYVPVDPWHFRQLGSFLTGQYSGILNPYVPIAFEDGVFVSGPEKATGKPYQQLADGIGSILNLVRFKFGDISADRLKEDIRNSELVGKFSHFDPNAKLLYNMNLPLRT